MKLDRERIDLVLAEQGISLAELAERMGCSRANVYSIVTSENSRPVTVNKIAAALNVPIYRILKEGHYADCTSSDQR